MFYILVNVKALELNIQIFIQKIMQKKWWGVGLVVVVASLTAFGLRIKDRDGLHLL